MSKPTPEQLEEVRLSGGTKQISYSKEGCRVVDKAPSTIQNQINAGIEEGLKEVKATRAQALLKKVRTESKHSPIKKVDVEGLGEPLFVKKGAYSQTVLAYKLANRNEFGVLDLNTEDQLTSFITGILYTFMVVSETDKSPYFESLEDAREFVEDETEVITDAVAICFYTAVDLNPAIFPEGKAAARKVIESLAERQKEKVSSTSPLPKPLEG